MIHFLRITLFFYFLGVVSSLAVLLLHRRSWSAVTPILVLVGFLLHLVAIVGIGLETGEFPIQDLNQTLSFLCWTTVLIYLLSYYRYRIESLNLIIPFLVVLLMSISNLLPEGTLGLHERLLNPLDRFHIVVAIVGVSMLFLTFATSLLYLVLDQGLKAKRPLPFLMRLPSLEMCERVGYRSLIAGFSLLTIGLVTGAVAHAGTMDGSFPWRREGLAILSWGILALILIARLARGWRGRRAAILTIIAFTGILVRMLRIF